MDREEGWQRRWSEANASALEAEAGRWAHTMLRVAKHEPVQVNAHTPAWLSGSCT